MKTKTKKKVIAIAGGVAFSTFIFTIGLTMVAHPAQWAMSGVCVVAFGVALFTRCTID